VGLSILIVSGFKAGCEDFIVLMPGLAEGRKLVEGFWLLKETF
jgi:hypothetical protein